MPFVVGQTRKIEKRGILILSEEEKLAQILRIDVSVLQLPYTYKRNLKYNPHTDYFGTYTLNYGHYCSEGKLLVFENQNIGFWDRKNEQVQENVTSYLETVIEILLKITPRLTPPLILTYTPADDLNIADIPLSVVKFVLEEGCIIEVKVTYLPFEKRTNTITFNEPTPDPPTPPGGAEKPPAPGLPPRGGVPGSGSKYEISPPYNAPTKDGGDTYVPPRLWDGVDDPTGDNGNAWRVTANLTFFYTDGRSGSPPIPSSTQSAIIYGRFMGTEYYYDVGYSYGGLVAKWKTPSTSTVQRTGFGGGGTSDPAVSGKATVISIEPA